jgi:hypothetical protein
MLIIGRITTALFWFNPLVWMLARQCHELSEEAVDDTVLRSNIRSTDYAELLISAARHDNHAILIAANGVAGSGALIQRVERVLDPSRSRIPPQVGWVVGCCAWALSVGGLLSALAPTGPLAAAAPDAIKPLVAISNGRLISQEPSRASSAETGPTAQPVPDPVSETAKASEEAQSRVISAPSGTPTLAASLVEAVLKGDLNTVDFLLASGVDPNSVVPGDGTPLIAAAKKGRLDLVQRLLDRGARINTGVSGDGNPLIAAAARGHTETVRLLLDRGADIEAIVPTDENALIQASRRGHLDVVRLLIHRGANVNSRHGVRTPLNMAKEGGHANIEQALISAGAKS